MTGRAPIAAALYAGFLALWALGEAARRREPSPYLVLSGALLEAALLLGAAIGTTQLGAPGQDTGVHAAYLAASVLLLPLGLLLSRDAAGRVSPAPLAVALVALAVVVLRAEATA